MYGTIRSSGAASAVADPAVTRAPRRRTNGFELRPPPCICRTMSKCSACMREELFQGREIGGVGLLCSHTRAPRNNLDAVHRPGTSGEEVTMPPLAEEHDLSAGIRRAQGVKRRHGKHQITQPVGSQHRNLASLRNDRAAQRYQQPFHLRHLPILPSVSYTFFYHIFVWRHAFCRGQERRPWSAPDVTTSVLTPASHLDAPREREAKIN